jgi:transposase
MEAVELLEQWMQWAWRCRIDAFVRLGNTIANHIDAILITREHRLSNAFSRRSTPASACSPVAP